MSVVGSQRGSNPLEKAPCVSHKAKKQKTVKEPKEAMQLAGLIMF